MNESSLADQLSDLIENALGADDDDLRDFYDVLREGVATLQEELERRDSDLEDEEEDDEDEDDEDWEDEEDDR
jgi:hypothetical protein